jgi:zinc protease
VLLAWRNDFGPNDDRAALALLQKILNGQSGRLFENLRNRRSLCYASGVQAVRGFGPGLFMGYVLTDPDSATEARIALQQELRRMTEENAADEEFERARQQLIGNLLISRQSNSARSNHCATDILYGRDPNSLNGFLDGIAAATADDVRRTAARYIHDRTMYQVDVGPESK